MKADTNDIATIFGKDVRYVVPLYQRPYIWNREEHWEPLWADVLWVMHRSAEPTVSGKPAPHFLGAVVLEQHLTQLNEIDVRIVIDGQQRLTTLQLFILAAARIAAESGCQTQARLLESLTRNNADLAKSSDQLLTVWPTNANRAAFVDVMTGEAAANDSANRVHEAFEFFAGTIRLWANEQENVSESFDTLTAVVRSLLKFVVIDLEPEDDPQVIFESLNARGTPLLAIDLVKNLVFQQAARSTEEIDLDELERERWRPFDLAYWRQEIVQGRLRRPRAEIFLMHWLTMKLGEEVHAQHLYAGFKKLLSVSDEPVTQTITEFAADRDIYEGFGKQPLGTVAQRFFERLESLDTTTAYPVALILFRGGLAEPQRDTTLRMLESWLVRRMICRLTAQGYNRLFVDLVKLLNAQDGEEDATVYKFLTSSDADSARWPDDDEVRSALRTDGLYKTIVRKRLVMLLATLEQDLRTDKAEPIDIPTNLWVEHLLPQKWQTHWPLADPTPEEIQRREDRVHRLGNLTLVTEKLNASMSNGRWATKKLKLNRHAVLLLNSTVVLDHPDVWDEEAIDHRTGELATRILRLWRGPEAVSWGMSTAVKEEVVTGGG